MLTADTFARARGQLRDLPVSLTIVATGLDKASFVRAVGPERTIAVGNGHNDVPMMKLAALRIAVVGPEGAGARLLPHADVVVSDVRDGLDLLIHPLRLKATLRD